MLSKITSKFRKVPPPSEQDLLRAIRQKAAAFDAQHQNQPRVNDNCGMEVRFIRHTPGKIELNPLIIDLITRTWKTPRFVEVIDDIIFGNAQVGHLDGMMLKELEFLRDFYYVVNPNYAKKFANDPWARTMKRYR